MSNSRFLLQIIAGSGLLLAFGIFMAGELARFTGQKEGWIVSSASELHPFIPAIIVASYIVQSWNAPTGARLVSAAVAAVGLASWLLRPPPDDRWKRRRKRLKTQLLSVSRRQSARGRYPNGYRRAAAHILAHREQLLALTACG